MTHSDAGRALASLADDAIDPLASPTFQQELPGALVAFDAEAMRALFQAQLFPAASRTITACAIDQATYLPGEACVVRYFLTIADADGASSQALVSAQAYPSRAACAAALHDKIAPLALRAAGHPIVSMFERAVGMDADQALALFAYPIDGDMPSLLTVSDGRAMRGTLAKLLPSIGVQVQSEGECSAELVDYGRQRRCTLRYRLAGTSEPGGTVVYGKLTGDGSGALASDISAGLRAMGQRAPTGEAFRVPRVLAWLPELKLSLLETISGQDPIGELVKSRLRGKPAPPNTIELEPAVEACARIGAALHSSGLALGPRRSADDELASLRRALAHVERISPELGALLLPHYERVAAAAQQSPALPLCFNHGDFTPGQFLFEGTNSGLIDLDSVCQAEPALDVAQFLTYLTVGGQKSKLSAEETHAFFADLRARFMQTYAGALGADLGQLQTRVAVYTSMSLLRRVLRSWQKLKPGRISGALAQAQALFTPAPVE